MPAVIHIIPRQRKFNDGEKLAQHMTRLRRKFPPQVWEHGLDKNLIYKNTHIW